MSRRSLSTFADIHTHDASRATSGDAVVSVRPDEPRLAGGWYSVGIHPWDTADGPPTLSQLKALVAAARDEHTVAIGECGFDRLRGGPIELQTGVFDFHARLAARYGLPLVIHAVRADDLVEAAVRRHRPAPGQWVIHGFRGNPRRGRHLVSRGLALSLGTTHHPDIPQTIPCNLLYSETD